MPSNPRKHLALFAVLTLALAGCAHDGSAPPPASAQAASAEYNTFDVQQGLVNVSKRLPRLLEQGQDLTYTINLTAQETARNVTVREEIPANVRYIRSGPEAHMLGNQLIWSFPELARGATRTLSVTLKPVQEGRIEGYTTVTVEPQAYAATMVGKAKLALSKSGPSSAIVGKDVTYELKVSNTGTYVAKAVSLTDQVAEGLAHACNARGVVLQVGDLEPGQSRTVPLTLKAVQKGKVRNVTLAHSSNADPVGDTCLTEEQLEADDLALLRYALRAAGLGPPLINVQPKGVSLADGHGHVAGKDREQTAIADVDALCPDGLAGVVLPDQLDGAMQAVPDLRYLDHREPTLMILR